MNAVAMPPFAGMFAKSEEVGRPKSMLLYGPPGTWKTTIAGSIAKVPDFASKRILFIDIDNGSEVLANDAEVQAKIEDGSFNIVPIDKLDPQAFAQMRYFLGGDDASGVFTKGTDALGVAFDPQWAYDVVIVDSLDVAQEVAVEWFLANTFADNGKPNTMKAWGEISKWTADMAWALQNDPRILGILVMHSKEGTDDDGKFRIKPKLSGSVKDNIAGIPSLVVYLGFESDPEDKNVTRVVATLGKSEITVTKNRWRLADKLPDFDLPLFYSLIAAKKADKAPAPINNTQPTTATTTPAAKAAA